MTILPHPAPNSQPDAAPPSICPACGLDGDGHRVPGPAPTAQYLCPTGLHLWSVSWFAEDGGAA